MQIGTVKIESKLALAPMAGVTDAAFRQICSELGAGYTVTELVSAKALCYHDAKTAQLLRPVHRMPWSTARRKSSCRKGSQRCRRNTERCSFCVRSRG